MRPLPVRLDADFAPRRLAVERTLAVLQWVAITLAGLALWLLRWPLRFVIFACCVAAVILHLKGYPVDAAAAVVQAGVALAILKGLAWASRT